MSYWDSFIDRMTEPAPAWAVFLALFGVVAIYKKFENIEKRLERISQHFGIEE
jgi:hypothetical protein